LRIALTHPTAWPEVRRGSERLLHDLAAHHAAAGHAVTIVTTTPAAPGADPPGVARIVLPRRSWAWGRVLHFHHGFAWDLPPVLREGRFDVVQTLNHHDAAAAAWVLRRGARFRLIHQCTGIPRARIWRRLPLEGLLFRAAMRHADAVIVISRCAEAFLAQDYGRAGVLLPPPVVTTEFARCPKPAAGTTRPRLLFTGDAAEPRKGAALLVRAFLRLRAKHPDLILTFAGPTPPATMAALRALAGDAVEALELMPATREQLPRLYAEASVTVNPAIWEAFGMVLVESLAAGTPVVGCDHAGTRDIVTDRGVGRLFEPGPIRGHAPTNEAALAEALDAALQLAHVPDTAARCRAHAEAFSWASLGPCYSAVLTEAAKPCHTLPAGSPRDRN
jgi:phosphatidyl-myo-inositol alpha-mannosyltransferase